MARTTVSTDMLKDLAVTTAKVNDLAVTTAKLAANAVTTAKIGDGEVTTPKLAAGVLFTTGDEKTTWKTVADAGWIMLNDGTIGNAASGATTRANADTEALYTLWWNNCADAQCPVSTGRGGSGAADFAANKTLKTPLSLGRMLAIAGAGAGLTSRVLGLATGAETHTLTEAQTPVKSHLHGAGTLAAAESAALSTGTTGSSSNTANSSTGDTAVTIAVSGSTAAASDATAAAHPIMNPSGFRNVMVKL